MAKKKEDPISLNEVVIKGKRPQPKAKAPDSVSFGYGASKTNVGLKDLKSAVKQKLVQADTSNANPNITRGNTDKLEAVKQALAIAKSREKNKNKK